ncbi:MAG: hypothetical protein N2D54_11420, partial [Chloroflexota bacterium]
VELESTPTLETILIQNYIMLEKYVYWKHIGGYAMLGDVHARMHKEIVTRNLHDQKLAVEVYGHWTPDEDRLETEILIAVK